MTVMQIKTGLAGKICVPLAIALLVFSTGCGHEHQACNTCSTCVAEASSPPSPQYPTPGPVGPMPGGDAAWNVQLTREWRHIVVHHSASPTGSAAAFDKAHRDRGWDGLGYHFVIGNGSGSGDGQVEVGYRWAKQQAGAHAGNYEFNQHGIGICLVGDFEHSAPPSERQMQSLRTLVAFLQARASIPT